MPLQRQVISWPLTGGLDSKTSPLMVQPGSHIQLDNVRQERTNEWRARNGTTQNAVDTLPQNLPPVLVASFGAGLVALTQPPPVSSPVKSAVATYSSGLSAARWQRLNTGSTGSGADVAAPSVISRRTVFPLTASSETLSHASSGITAFTSSGGSRLLATLADGIAIGDGVATGGGGTSTTRARMVWGATYYCRITVAFGSGTVSVDRYSEAGVLIGNTVLGADCSLATRSLDAIKYPGSATITVVFNNNAGGIHFIEYNDTTDTIVTNATFAQNGDNCVSLLPDPDSSGVRFVGVCSSVPDVRVLRCTSAGVATTNEQIENAITATQIGGCAYSAGAGYMVAYQTASGIKMAKKRSGVISTPTLFNDTRLTLHSNAWRETGDDQMRFIYAFHGPAGDAQDSYFIAAAAFDQAATNDTTLFNAQAKMLPLDAGPALFNIGSLPQVIRLTSRSVEVPLLRLTRSGLAGSTVANRYSVDIFTITDMTPATQFAADVGQPRAIGSSALAPGGTLIEFSKGKNVLQHGISVIPPKVTLAGFTLGGGLTLLATYQISIVIITRNDAGEEWRSPPSVPASITLTGTQDTIQATPSMCFIPDDAGRTVIVEAFMTKANGSVFQKFSSAVSLYSASNSALTANLSDTALGSGEFIYVSAELANVLTPPFSHIEPFGGRVWGIHRDYKQSLWPSKTLAIGKSPEWANELQMSFVDEEGDMTNLAGMDDKLVVFKQSAIYVVTGDGPNNAGVGGAFSITRIDTDVGAIVGSPVISTGSEVFFVSARGIYMIDRSLQVSFVGAPVDQFLNQPLIQTREVIVGGVFSSATNEVRFQTTNYRLVYDRLRGLWYRDTGAGMQNVVSTCMVGSKQALFKSDGTMWVEGDETVTQDGAGNYTGLIRSAWVRPAGYDGRMRLYSARVLLVRTPGATTATPAITIFYDNDDAISETYSPAPLSSGTVARGSAQPRRHRCSAFSLQLQLQANNDTLRLEAWGAEVGTRPGAFRNNSGTAERWT